MLGDGDWSGLVLELDGRARVKGALEQSPRELLGERGFLQGLVRWGAGWGAGVHPPHRKGNHVLHRPEVSPLMGHCAALENLSPDPFQRPL